MGYISEYNSKTICIQFHGIFGGFVCLASTHFAHDPQFHGTGQKKKTSLINIHGENVRRPKQKMKTGQISKAIIV